MPRKSKKKVAAVASAATAALEQHPVVPPNEDIEETSPSKKRKLGESDDEDATLEFDSTAVEQLKTASSKAGAIYDSAMDVDNENNVDGSSVVGKKNDGKSGRAEGVPMWMQAANVIDADIQIALADLAKTSLIDDKILENLRTMGVEYLFPVQTEVIPFILRGSIIGGDVSVSAPTGSGKFHQTLTRQVLRRLRALVLVPTRELVVQVYEVFRDLCKNMNLRVEALYGDKSFAEEQKKLVSSDGSSLVDVVITTPGRLVDHLQGTDKFTLIHLRFLVADEADRLLTQSYQDWLPKVLSSVHTTGRANAGHVDLVSAEEAAVPQFRIQVGSSRDTALLSAKNDTLQFPPLQKLLFSATLTQNPKKLASLKLVSPTYFTAVQTAGHVFRIPTKLEQRMVVCRDEEKPLAIVQLLASIPAGQQVLCFTASVESTHRLSVLLQILQQASKIAASTSIIEYSSNLSQQERDKLMSAVKQGRSAIIICSDVMSRGLDIQDIGTVINYDAPSHIKTYVHRVGRTARAGRGGKCFTLVRQEEVWYFKQMLKKAENSTQIPEKLAVDAMKAMEQDYKDALKQLKSQLERERSKPTQADARSKEGVRLRSQSSSDVVLVRQALLEQLNKNWFSA